MAVQFNAVTNSPYFDNYDETTGAQRNPAQGSGELMTYVAVMYGRYDNSLNLMSFDKFDGSSATSTSPNTEKEYLMKHLDMYASQDDNCKITCQGNSGMYCGCASSWVIPKVTDGKPYIGMQFANVPGVKYPQNVKSMYTAPTNKKGTITNNIGAGDAAFDKAYQSKCIGPNFPAAVQSRVPQGDLNASTLSTFATLYRVNPSSAQFSSTVFKESANGVIVGTTAA